MVTQLGVVTCEVAPGGGLRECKRAASNAPWEGKDLKKCARMYLVHSKTSPHGAYCTLSCWCDAEKSIPFLGQFLFQIDLE